MLAQDNKIITDTANRLDINQSQISKEINDFCWIPESIDHEFLGVEY